LTDGAVKRKLPLTLIARITADYVAGRFGISPGKGRIAVGADADLVIVDMASSTVLQADDLQYRHRHSPYIGKRMQGRITRTLVRGVTVCLDGKIVSGPVGQMVRPQRPS
jgi:allantoinase